MPEQRHLRKLHRGRISTATRHDEQSLHSLERLIKFRDARAYVLLGFGLGLEKERNRFRSYSF
jgi:hypothetical protein